MPTPAANRGLHLIPFVAASRHNGIVTYSIGANPISSVLASPFQGVKRGVSEAEAAMQKIANNDLNPDNFTALIQAEISIKANRVVATTANEMVGTLLNRKA